MSCHAIALLLSIRLIAAAAAGEPSSVELEIPKPDPRATVPVNPLAGQVGIGDPLVLPSAPGDLVPVPPAGDPLKVLDAGTAAAGIGAEPQAGTLTGSQPQASAEAPAQAGQVQFDLAKPSGPGVPVIAAAPAAARISLDDILRRTGPRQLRGVFIQQEQEGNLLATDPRDSSGNVFRYYRPAEMRPALMAQVQNDLGPVGKAFYGFRRSFNFWNKDPYKVWKAWPLTAKLSYLEKLESAVVSEKGKGAAWSGKTSLILERAPAAPDFITKNPIMEDPPYMEGHRGVRGARFVLPEIVTDKDHPAATINEAIGRSRMIIAQTGHAGTQYHVFLKAEPQRLAAQLSELQSTLQLVNNMLFAQAAAENFQNATLMALQPWHGGRSRRVAELLARAAPEPQVSSGFDADSEKHSFVGLRYWGVEDGKTVISFELRDVSLPWKRRGGTSLIRGGDENVPMPERDYSSAQYNLTFLSLYAEKLSAGRAPRFSEPSLELNVKRANALIDARARQRGFPPDAYYGLEDFAKRLSGVSTVPQGYLFPFAASEPSSWQMTALIDELLKVSASMRTWDREQGGLDPQRRRYLAHLFGEAYRQWATSYEAQARSRFTALFGAIAAP